jgi:hypothetical protein
MLPRMVTTTGIASLSPVVWLYLLFVVTPVEFSIGSVALTPLRVLLLVMAVPLTLRLFAGQFGKVTAVDVLFYIHMTWATLAVAINNPARVVENVGSAAVEFLGGYLVARAYIRTPGQFVALIKALVLMVAVLVPFGVPELFNGKPLIPGFIEALPGLSSAADIANPKRMGLERVQNVFDHPIHYGLFSSVVFTLLILGLYRRISVSKQLFWASFVLAGVFMSLSSGAFLAIILQVGLLAWALVLWRVQRKWMILLGLMALAYVTVDLLSNRTPSKVFMTYATFSAQTAYYRANINEWGMYNVWQNPIFGLGLRSWVRPAYMLKGSVDNFWLVMAMRYGIPGFLLLVAGYLWGLILIGRAKLDFSPGTSLLRLAWMITFCGLSFTLVTVHVWSTMYSFVFFLFGTGMWFIHHTAADEGGPAPVAEEPPRGRPATVYRRTFDALPGRATPTARYRRDHAPAEEQVRQEGAAATPAYSRAAKATEQEEPKRSGPKYRRDHGGGVAGRDDTNA